MDNKLEELECMPNAPITAPRNKAKFWQHNVYYYLIFH
jgi:hypothetical protein